MTFFYLTFSSTIRLNRSKHFGFTLHIKVSVVNTALTLLLKGGLVEGLSTPPDPKVGLRYASTLGSPNMALVAK